MPNSWSSSTAPSTSAGGPRGAFDLAIIEHCPGRIVLRADGGRSDLACAAFAAEAGGHRWQRIPPNDKHGRVHSSTVTVALLRAPAGAAAAIGEADLVWRTCRGSGPGGQHRNKTESAVEVIHRPTGLRVRLDRGRSQQQNRRAALEILCERIAAQAGMRQHAAVNDGRRAQIGSGQRGDKIRTVQVQHGWVKDHRTLARIRLDDFLAGRLAGLHG
jgi:peptide chain release factor 1